MSPLLPRPLGSHCRYSDATFNPQILSVCQDKGSLVTSALQSQRPSSFALLRCCQFWCVCVQGWGRDPKVVLCTLRIHLLLSSASPWCLGAAPSPCLCSLLASGLEIAALLPTSSPTLSFQVAVLTSELLYPQCSLTLLVSLVTGIFQREANRTVMSCAVLPMRDDLS